MKVLVCGGRDFYDYHLMFGLLDKLKPIITEIIHGAAPGADSMAADWAAANQVSMRWFPADWKTHGKAAGPIRNRQMLEEGKPDLVLAFPGGYGTENMVKQSLAANVLTARVCPPVSGVEE